MRSPTTPSDDRTVASADTRTREAAVARLSRPVSSARFVDSTRAAALERLGVQTVGDLLLHVPHRYLDLSELSSLGAVGIGIDATVVGVVHEVKVKKPRPRLTITEVALVDDTGVLVGVWFNQPWVAQRFTSGQRLAFAGRIELSYGLKTIKNPFVETLVGDGGTPLSLAGVLPVHRATEGLSTAWLRRLISAALDDHGDVADPVPAGVRLERELVPRRTALRDIHFPRTVDDARRARTRLAYDELLLLQLYMATRRHASTQEQAGFSHVIDGPSLKKLRTTLPWPLTADQERSVDEILVDMSRPHPMNRLLLGDVGTGKTIVAAHAVASAVDSRGQAAMMAPTEVLAQQYASKVGPLLDDSGIRWRLLRGSTPEREKSEVINGLKEGKVDVVFGTHALLEERVEFRRLTLSIVDEQHRFGVSQRLGLRSKGTQADMLVMTATPIPRSLALTLYGDLATSTIKERPSGSPGVATFHVKPHQADRAHAAVRSAVRSGRQAYVVCALVDESDTAKAKAATREAERLRTLVFADMRVGLLTGRMRSADKSRVMEQFRSGDLDVLVSTTVIEVGVDVANATVMIIEDAHRFGLAQLHQLRGRVGRGTEPGEVWLVSDPHTLESRERISAILATNDGFVLAERDLELRGAGQLMGDRQHGLPDLRIADLLTDLELVEKARSDAFGIVSGDPNLEDPVHLPLRAELSDRFAQARQWVNSG